MSKIVGPLKFDWPVSRVVVVGEKVDKHGGKAHQRYQLHICPRKEGGIHVRYHAFAFLELDGHKADDPKHAEQLAQATALAKLIPDLAIGADGALIDIVDFDAKMKRVAATLGPSSRDVVERMIGDPGMRAMLKAKAGDIWASWVGLWRPFEPSGSGLQVFQVNGPKGASAGFSIKRIAVEGKRLRLRLRMIEEDADLRPKMRALLEAVVASAPDAAQAKRMAEQVKLQRVTAYEVVTSPLTMTPLEAHWVSTLHVQLPGKKPQAQVERHDYRFDWKAGAKIKARCE